MQNWIAVPAAALALVAVLCALAVIYLRMLPATGRGRSVLASLGAGASGSAAWLFCAALVAPGIGLDLYLLLAVVAAVAAFVATVAVRATGARLAVVLGFGFTWCAAVFVPTALLSFTGLGVLPLSPVDHGGSLALNVASGSAVLGVLFAGGTLSPRVRVGSLGRPPGIAAVLVLSIGWIGWLAAAELAIDQAAASIVLNGVIGAVGGAAGWLIVQRILRQSTTLNAVATGLTSGLFAVAAGAPLFTPVSAAAVGVIAGAASCHFTLRRVSATRRPQWFLVGLHLVAGGIGVVALGLLATDMGFLFTGQVSLIGQQLVSVGVVASYSTGVSFILWSALTRVPTAARQSRRVRVEPGA